MLTGDGATLILIYQSKHDIHFPFSIMKNIHEDEELGQNRGMVYMAIRCVSHQPSALVGDLLVKTDVEEVAALIRQVEPDWKRHTAHPANER